MYAHKVTKISYTKMCISQMKYETKYNPPALIRFTKEKASCDYIFTNPY